MVNHGNYEENMLNEGSKHGASLHFLVKEGAFEWKKRWPNRAIQALDQTIFKRSIELLER